MSRFTFAAFGCLALLAATGGAWDGTYGASASYSNAPSRDSSASYRVPAAPAQTRVYVMPAAVNFVRDTQWQDYLRRHEAELAAIRATNATPAPRPAWPAGHGRFEPPTRLPKPAGPTGPGSLREFKDTFAELVKDYVDGRARKNGGVFALSDDATKETYELRLLRVHSDDIRMISSTTAAACVDFETVKGPKRSVDLDFQLDKDWEWSVGKIFVHGVNGRLRFAYDDSHRRVRLAQESEDRPIPKPSAPAHLTAEVRFHEPSGDGRLEGGEQGGLLVTVSNAGPGPAYGVKLALNPEASAAGVAMPSEVRFGDLKAGESLTQDASLSAAETISSGKAGVLLSVSEGNGFDTEPVLVEFETEAYAPPRLELVAVSVPGGIIRGGETSRISVTVANTGRGTAAGVVGTLRLGGPDLFMAGEPSAALGDLAPGESKSAEFEFFVNKRLRAGLELPISLSMTEAMQRYNAEIPLKLALDRATPARRILSIPGRPALAPAAESEDVDVPPRSKTPENPDAYAVIVGIEKYRDLPSVDYAGRDAQAMYDYLTQSMGFKPENVVLLQNERAAMADLATYLGPWLSDRVGRGSRVFFYYAGHGTPDAKTGEGYLIPYDGSPGYAQTRAYPLKKLYESLASLPAEDVVVALDSCFSGAGGRSLLAEGTRPLVRLAPAPTAANVVTLSASAGDQISASSHEARHGLLTYFLLKGLRGEADADKNGRITTLELFKYIKPAVIREARKQHVEQEPVLSPAEDVIGKRGARVWLVVK